MTFFRTKDNRRDPKPCEEARKQRRQQLQAQQQLLANARSEEAESQPVPNPTVDSAERAANSAVLKR